MQNTPGGPSQARSENRSQRRSCRKRERVYGPATGWSLDRNAKVRIVTWAKAWSARHKTPRQHRGPLTRATIEVLVVLLWGFHNSKNGACFPSYEAIAKRAQCNRDTVYVAIRALEAAGILTWVNRIIRIRVRGLDLFGNPAKVSKVIFTSNAYSFRDPLPCHVPMQDRREKDLSLVGSTSKSENPTGTPNQDYLSSKGRPKIPALDPQSPLEDALIKLGRRIGGLDNP